MSKSQKTKDNSKTQLLPVHSLEKVNPPVLINAIQHKSKYDRFTS